MNLTLLIILSLSPFSILMDRGTYNRLPINQDKQYEVQRNVQSNKIRRISGYNLGDFAQNWGNPCVGASNINLCDYSPVGNNKICAANFVPFYTLLDIEDVGRCIVLDRMNSRFPNSVDLAFPLNQKKEALEFGLQFRNVKILKLK